MEDWIAIGNGNHITEGLLREHGLTEDQITSVRSCSGCYAKVLRLESLGFPVHNYVDRHWFALQS